MTKNNCGIIRTNVKLTSNYKLLIGDDIYISSIESDLLLSNISYKNVIYKVNNTFASNIRDYWISTPNDVIYKVSNFPNVILNTYENQYDNVYWAGVERISDKTLGYEYEYFAPMILNKKIDDTFFAIFSLDGFDISEFDKNKFKKNYFDKFKLVELIDLSKKIQNITDELLSYGSEYLNIDIDIDRFTKWYGIDISDGIYTSKSQYINDYIENSQRLSELDTILTNGFEKNTLITNNILNISYLFTDKYATPFTVKRYSGFYGQLNKIKSISTITPTKLKTYYINTLNINIDSNNVFIDINTNLYINPFYLDIIDNLKVEYNGIIYNVIYDGEKFKIISDISFFNKINLLNRNIVNIQPNTNTSIYQEIVYNINYFNTINDGNYDINDCILIDNIYTNFYMTTDLYNIVPTYSDSKMYFIKIADSYHRISFSNDRFVIYSDISTIKYEGVVDIYEFVFNDILDFDTDIIDTKYANYENETDEIDISLQPKLYKQLDNNIDEYLYNNAYINIPTTSEYIASCELFEIKNINNELYINDLWKKNPIILKYGKNNSIDINDCAYRFNTAYNFNLVDVETIVPDRRVRNLDYFYTVVDNISDDINYQTLNIINSKFNVYDYFNMDNYFNDFFNYDEYIGGKIKRVVKKVDISNTSDVINTNSFLFKGISCEIYKNINDVNISTSDFNDYSISIICANKTHNIVDGNIIPMTNIPMTNNNLLWKRITMWEYNTMYMIGDVVYYKYYINDDTYIIDTFIVKTNHVSINTPNTELNINYDIYGISTANIIYFSYKNYIEGDVVYYDGEWYVAKSNVDISQYDNNGVLIVNRFPSNTTYWTKILLYDKNISQTYYVLNNRVYLNGILIKDITPDIKKKYTIGDVIIDSNGLMCVISGEGFLDNGINLYINNDEKNMIFHIYINDNTIDISNYNRDTLYTNFNSKLTAKSFIDYIQINEIGTFVNNFNITIKTNNVISSYDYNTFPYRFIFEGSSKINKNITSMFYDKYFINNSLLKNKEVFKYDNIDKNSLNYYNYAEVAYVENKQPVYFKSSVNTFFGLYSPIMKVVPFISNNIINTNLSDFGEVNMFINKKSNFPIILNGLELIYPMIDYVGIYNIKYNIFTNQYTKNYYKNFTSK